MAPKKSKNLDTRNVSTLAAKEIKARGANQAQWKKQGTSRHRGQQGMNDKTQGPNEGSKPNRRSSRLTGAAVCTNVPPTKRHVSNSATNITAKTTVGDKRHRTVQRQISPSTDNSDMAPASLQQYRDPLVKPAVSQRRGAAKLVARKKSAHSQSLPESDNGGLPVNEPRNPAGAGVGVTAHSTRSRKDVVHYDIPDRDHVPYDTGASAKIRELEKELQAEKGGCS
jgi:hypothetical protein